MRKVQMAGIEKAGQQSTETSKSNSSDNTGFFDNFVKDAKKAADNIGGTIDRVKAAVDFVTTEHPVRMSVNAVSNAKNAKAMAQVTSNVFHPRGRMPYDAPRYTNKSAQEKTIYHVRASKMAQVGFEERIQISEGSPGGKASVKISYGVVGALGGKTGKGVESNWRDTAKSLPGQESNTTTTFAEGIVNTNAIGGEYRLQMECNSYEDAVKLAGAVQKDTLEAVKAKGKSEGQTTAKAKGDVRQLAEKSGAACKEKGYDVSLSWEPFNGKLYGTTTLNDVAGLRDASNRTPLLKKGGAARSGGSKALATSVGAYGDIAAKTELRGKFSQDFDTNGKNADFFADDFDPSAHKSFVVKMSAGGGSSSMMSFGSLVVGGVLKEGSAAYAKGIILDKNDNWTQTALYFEGKGGTLDQGKVNQFIDLRRSTGLNKSKTSRSGHLNPGTTQGGYANLNIDKGIVRAEKRIDVRDTPQETLKEQVQSDLENLPAYEKITEVNKANPKSPLTGEWLAASRKDYEASVADGPVSDEKWQEVIDGSLTSDSSGNSGRLGKWEKRNITDTHREAFNDGWKKVSEEHFVKKSEEIDKMTVPQLYTEYMNRGMRHPGVYMDFYKADKNVEKFFVGQTVNRASDGSKSSKVPEAKNMHKGKDPFGLYKYTKTTERETFHKVGSFAATPKGWEKAREILDDKVAGPALQELSDKEAFPRTDRNGVNLSPSPAAQLMYDGVTPTREIAELEKQTGVKRDFSDNPGIMTVRNSSDWQDIGKQAISHLASNGVSTKGIEVDDVIQQIKQTNFEGLSEQEMQECVFEGAHLIMPPVE